MIKKFKNTLEALIEVLPYLAVLLSSYAFYKGDVITALYFIVSATVYLQFSKR